MYSVQMVSTPYCVEATDLKQLPLQEWWANMYLRRGKGNELPVAHPARGSTGGHVLLNDPHHPVSLITTHFHLFVLV